MTREPEQIFLSNHSDSQNFDFRRNSVGNPQDNLENVKDFSNVCRTCAAVTEFIVPIFEGEGLQNKLADKIHQHLPIKVSEQDSLPRVVCYQCTSTLLAWHELVKCCLQADEALKTKQAVWAAEASVQEKPGPSDHVTIKDLDDRRDDPTSQDEWSGAADAQVFHCAECGRYLPRRALLDHMAAHASRLQPLPPPPAPRLAPSALPDDFSDHSDNENGFVSLPESVFEAIEDSRDETRADRPPPAEADVGASKYNAPAGGGKRTRSCPTCGKQYAVASSYFYHMKHSHASGEAERPHACASCGRGFKTRGALRAHEATHAVPSLACARCRRTFRTRAARLLHACAGAAPERWACARCGRVFPRRGPLLRHERRHGPRALRCPAAGCARRFHVRGDLARHARTHEPPARARCPHAACAATFAQPRYLRVHLAKKHATTTTNTTPPPPVRDADDREAKPS